MRYIHELSDWPRFYWSEGELSAPLAAARYQQGRLLGHMDAIGFSFRAETNLQTLTADVVKSSEIEGEVLEESQVRSSIARRLGMDIAGLVPADRNVEGVVEMMLDATQNFDKPLTKERFFDWHAALFPTGRSGMTKIIVGTWRDESSGSMEVISGPMGRERIHFEAPHASRLEKEMANFINWFNGKQKLDPVIKAAIAHLWFVTIHPFEDGNGRIARAISDMQLARSENNRQRFYSMSTQIRNERSAYYKVLESTQKALSLDITSWLEWFLSCLNHALSQAESTINGVLERVRFWDLHADTLFNDSQRLMLNKLLEKFEGKLTSSKWAKITRSSQDTALRDLSDLVERGILSKDSGGGRSTSYSLRTF
jgi:Fic family protein